MINLELYELKTLLQEAAELGASLALAKIGIKAAELTQNQAYRTYGRSTVDRLTKKMTNRPRQEGIGKNATIRIDRTEFEALVKAEKQLGKYHK